MPISPPIYPTQLPIPLIDYKGLKESNVISNKMDSGRYRQRKRFSGRRETVNVTFQFSYIQFGLFQHWFEEIIDSGASPFTMYLPNPATRQLADTTVRWMKGEYNFKTVAAENMWKVSGTLIIENFEIMTNVIYEALLASAQIQEHIQNCPIEFEAVGVRVVEETASFTVGTEHAGAVVRCNSPNDIIVTLPEATTPTEDLGEGFNCIFTRAGSGNVEFTGETSNVIIDSDGLRIWNPNNAAAVHFVDSNHYFLYGNLY